MLHKLLLKIKTNLLRRPNFRTWCKLEDKKYSLIQAVEDVAPTFPRELCGYISTALGFNLDYSKIYWLDTIKAFYKIHGVTSTIRKIPITSNQDKFKADKDVWDYQGRLWYLYANLVASAYGWSQEQIAKLDVDDALAYLQEILTEKHLDKEFMWMASEIAYPYDKSTKKSKFHPLTRPYWMVKPKKEIPKGPPMPKALLPVGNVVRLGHETKEIES